METELKVVCCSKGRAKNVITTKFIDKMDFFVPENEADEYKDNIPKTCTVTPVPMKIKGIVKTRQYALDKYRDIDHFQIDDDVIQVWDLFDLDTTANKLKDKNRIWDILNETRFIAKELKAKIYGYCNIKRPIQFDGMSLFSSNGYINASYCGFIAGHDYNYDINMKEGEDHFMSCLSIYKDRYHFIDKRYSFITKQNFESDGGCSSYRSTEGMKETTITLKKYFGDSIGVKSDGGLRKCVNIGERSFKKKF